ncbi:anhydro-N-acetylmuramic acid kinase [Candidatus Pelagibacter sp.]|uniref:anhydro-N-acetylmuramic acid kinase n=1 Tax=Candidatus Pelagibacter sp. TaxID=2024849 RepID=UPI003F824B57
MEKKLLNCLGMMSGTSMDGVDISLIKTDGENFFERIIDKYYEFPDDLYDGLIKIREIISSKEDLKIQNKKIRNIEKKFTLFHASLIEDLKSNFEIDVVGFHGQTIFHSPKNKISFQIGDGNLLSQLVRKKVVFNFRKNDINHAGQGAPLTPIFHNLISKKIYEKNRSVSLYFINIGGITNLTKIDKNFDENFMEGYDIGPGNCLIDNWVRKNSALKYDENGKIASLGRLNELTLNQAIDNFEFNDFKNSLDINDFDISFLRGLDFEEGCTTVTEFTAYLIANGINNLRDKNDDLDLFIFCGGGRKNHFLINRIKNYINNEKRFIIKNVDDYEFDGDFIESQAFGYLAARSIYNLPISFPKTTRCLKSISGGEIVDNN